MEEKNLDISDEKCARKNISDVKVFGNTDIFKLVCKASSDSQGWMKSTKVCEVKGGCVVQVTTQQRNQPKTTLMGIILKFIMRDKYQDEITYSVAEAVTFVPNAKYDDFVK